MKNVLHVQTYIHKTHAHARTNTKYTNRNSHVPRVIKYIVVRGRKSSEYLPLRRFMKEIELGSSYWAVTTFGSGEDSGLTAHCQTLFYASTIYTADVSRKIET